MLRVRGEGPLHAEIVVVAEAPGEHEGRPLVGPSGQLLERWWLDVGLHRSQLRIENVCEIRPPNNKIEALGGVELEGWIADCRERLARLTPQIVVPLGNTALLAVTGRKGITKHRGSVYDIETPKAKAIASLHPAAVLRQPYWEKRCRRDWRRVVEVQHGHYVAPARCHHVRPHLQDCRDFLGECEATGRAFSLDIETPGNVIACVGFALDSHESLTIPTLPNYWGREAMPEVWRIVRRLCATPNPKILQNGLFDAYWLRRYANIELNNYVWDTLAMHHCLDSNDDHSLAYMASIDTWQPFWKDEAKDETSLAKYTSNIEALWTYNGIDACVTRELFDVYHRQLVERGRLDFYHRHYAALFEPLLALMLHGVNVEHAARRVQLTRLLRDTIACEGELQRLSGRRLHAKTGLSTKAIREYLVSIGIKVPRKRQTTGQFGETVDEVAIRKLVRRYPKFRAVGEQILKHREAKKKSEFLDAKRFDTDARFRSSYKFTTATGRLASSKNPQGTGANAQNIDRDLRAMFVPDPGCVFLECDLSQAESRIVGMLSGDKTLIELARTPPDAFDVHRFNASVIFNKPEMEITKVERYLGKRAIHASNYGMRGKKLSELLLNDGHFIGEKESQALIDAYLMRFPAILQWQQDTRATMLRERKLTNSWGRELSFEFDRMDDETYRQGYAFVPQSEVIDLLNQWGFLPLWEMLRHKQLGDGNVNINLHVHDALVISTPPMYAYEIAAFLGEALSAPRMIAGNAFSMYCEFKLGKTWKGGIEFKQLPDEKTMRTAADSLMSS